MGLLDFLNTLENTLESIEVKGKHNIDAMAGCFMAIEQMRDSFCAMAQKELMKPNGGEEVGRQSDIGTDTGNDSNKQ